MSSSGPRKTNQIVFRLRATFSIIVLLLLLLVAIASVQLRYLDRSKNQIIERSVPDVVDAHKLESTLAKIVILQNKIQAADNNEAVDELKPQFKLLKTEIEQSITRVSHWDFASPLSELMIQLETSNASLLPIRVALNEKNNLLSQASNELDSLRDQLRVIIEPQLIEAETSLYNAIASLYSEQTSRTNDLAILSKQVYTQNTLTEISFRFLSATDAAEQLSRQNPDVLTEPTIARINTNLRSMAKLMATLSQDRFRVKLTQLTGKLYDVILGRAGISELLDLKAESQLQFAKAEQQQADIVTQISTFIGDVVQNTRNEIAKSASIFQQSLMQTVLYLVIGGLLITAVVLIVSYLVVEQQINQRMSRLTSAVLDIAEGDINREVPVNGHDELGLIANALKVFRSNAVKLRTSNDELEQFAYAASHDLRSPLRAIENLAQWTIEDAGDTLPVDCQNHLTKIIDRTQRLSRLQTALLEYSRAGHANSVIELVKLNPLVSELSELLDPQGNYPIVYSGHIESIHTYKTPLHQILLNLVGNAIKHHDRPHGSLSILVRPRGKRVLISVIDDGPGIESDYQEQIFELFSALQPKDEVEGSGLGLALVRKLVDRYGGIITVTSDPSVQRGTEFSFDWPTHAA